MQSIPGRTFDIAAFQSLPINNRQCVVRAKVSRSHLYLDSWAASPRSSRYLLRVSRDGRCTRQKHTGNFLVEDIILLDHIVYYLLATLIYDQDLPLRLVSFCSCWEFLRTYVTASDSLDRIDYYYRGLENDLQQGLSAGLLLRCSWITDTPILGERGRWGAA
jgi:hypothetical protein